MIFQRDIPMSQYTTIETGGNAKYFISCGSEDEIIAVLAEAKKLNEKVQVISGGSNIIFPDDGFDGIVLKVDLKGIKIFNEKDNSLISVKAGESWDDFVLFCIESGLQGVECMSGIPGSAGAVPVQNVGAYGQEVKDAIDKVRAIDRKSLQIKIFENQDCRFDYRQSRFKKEDKDRFIITEVLFKLNKGKEPEIKYPELRKFIEENTDFRNLKSVNEKLFSVRNSVMELRKKKSMLADKSDPNSKSCGSFFMNPVLSKTEFEILGSKFPAMPFYESGDKYKIPAAWMIENAGYYKGYVFNGAGISENHSLAIVNRGGNTTGIMNLASKIENDVFKKFGVRLVREPVLAGEV